MDNANSTETWTAVASVKKLYMYPLKSGRRLKLQGAECTQFGFMQLKKDAPSYQLRDRSLIVYKEADKEFQTACQYPKLVSTVLSVHDSNNFAVNGSNMETLHVKIPDSENCEQVEITVFDNEKLLVTDCGEAAAKWFSQYLIGKMEGLRLGFHDGKYQRNITETHKPYLEFYKHLSNESLGMCSDLSSYHLINEASVNDLVSKIPNDNVTFKNFRPNIFIEGAQAFDEDSWNLIKIGTAIFRNARPCTRCILSNIHPDSATRNQNFEPLRTLRKYRLVTDPVARALDSNSPAMGLNLGLVNPGIVQENDTVYVTTDK